VAHHYREFIAWQKAIQMVNHAYRLTKQFPSEEFYGLATQMRRAAVSVPSNIAEGQGRRTNGEFAQFLGHAFGSLVELETQVTIAANLGYLETSAADEFLSTTEELGRIINGLISSISPPSPNSKLETRNSKPET
jgi:four helix bundle protein